MSRKVDECKPLPLGALATMHAGNLMLVSSGGGNRFDMVATLDPAALTEKFSFVGIMKNGVTKQLDDLESFFNQTEGAFGMSAGSYTRTLFSSST